MATLVTFHAHPDDEAIATGGTMAKAAAEGHRVVLVVGTRGEHGEVEAGFLGHEEELWQRRVEETHRAAEILGVSRVEFLGYRDSGMMGTETNELEGSFWTADLEEAAGRLADILREERADVLTIYDDNGGYGHPDHIQVHRVGKRAAELAGTPQVYESTINRDDIVRSMQELPPPEGMDMPDFENEPDFGVAEERITTRVDVTAYTDVKRKAMAAHASQIAENSFFLRMPPDVFARVFGQEWYIRPGHRRNGDDDWETSIL